MKKHAVILMTFVMAIMFSFPVYAQVTKDALMGLKKLQARCQAGIAYRDYSNAVADALFPVKIYLTSADAKKYPELALSVKNTMQHYEYAGYVWDRKMQAPRDDMLSKGFIWDKGELGKEVKSLYPAAEATGGFVKYYPIDLLLPVIWKEASKELEIASDQYAKVETNISNAPIASNDMVEKLKLENNNLKDELIKSQKENLDLRAQITELQKENASLKAKQKKK
jgi:hypothetical protein